MSNTQTKKFRFYITDIGNGEIVGTDSTNLALEYAKCEDFFVVDTETGQWLQSEGRSQQVEDAINCLNQLDLDEDDDEDKGQDDYDDEDYEEDHDEGTTLGYN